MLHYNRVLKKVVLFYPTKYYKLYFCMDEWIHIKTLNNLGELKYHDVIML